MGFDIRLPIGYLFSILGALLTVYGVLTLSSPIYQHSLGMNINMEWGVVLLIFGLLMAYFAKRSQGRPVQRESGGTAPSSTVRRQMH